MRQNNSVSDIARRRGVQADEEQAFETFVAAVADRLLLSAILLVGGDRGAAEDLVQGAFERTYLRWSKITDGHQEAYLRRVLVNGATSRWRRLRARVIEVPLQDDGPWTLDVAAPAVDQADQLTQRASLIQALATLPPRQRAVVVLRYVEDLPERDVAAALGCSIGSVRAQSSRGLARLRASDHLHALGRRPAGLDILTNGSSRSNGSSPSNESSRSTENRRQPTPSFAVAPQPEGDPR
jgi:RNA polymerase sigma-70 factor (sigma-E family)